MNQLITTKTLDPNRSLEVRTSEWIVTIYQEAAVQVEIEHADDTPELAPWKLLTDEERQTDPVETLEGEKRQWNMLYQNLVDEKALEIASGTIDSVRAAMANIIANRKRKQLRWQQLTSYKEVKKIAKETIVLPAGSQGK